MRIFKNGGFKEDLSTANHWLTKGDNTETVGVWAESATIAASHCLAESKADKELLTGNR